MSTGRDEGQRPPVVIVIGMLPTARALLEARLGHVTVRCLLAKRDGGMILANQPQATVLLVERFADEAGGFEEVLVVDLGIAKVWHLLEGTLLLLAEFGASVVRAVPGTAPWPAAKNGVFDSSFQGGLVAAIEALVLAKFPRPLEPPQLDEQGTEVLREVKSEILRGLVAHSKMGPNNHSHEDDLWKGRGQCLRSRDKHRIVMELLRDRLICRKKNNSMGGKGWVYWISDVAEVRRVFPELEPLLA